MALPEHAARRPTPSTAAAAARPTATTPSTSATSATTTARTAARRAPSRRSSAPRRRARGHARRALHAAHAGRRSRRSRCPCPGSTTSTTRSAPPRCALALGAPLDDVDAGLQAVAPAFGRAETLRVGGRDLSILLVKNPAGANEVLRTLALEDGEHDLFAVLNDHIADGRDVSWVWDADFEVLAPRVRRATCSGTRAAEMALRLKYAGVAADAHRRRARPRGRARPRRWRDGDGPLYALPTYTAMLALRELLVARGAAPRSAFGDEPEPIDVLWHDLECGGYDADLPLWRELAAARGRAGARRRRRHRARRARPRPPRATRSSRSTATPSCSAALRERARRACPSTTGRRPTRATSTSAAASRSSSCRCRRSSCSAAPRAARRFLAPRARPPGARRAARRRAGRRARGLRRRARRARRCPTCARSTACVYASRPVAVRDLGDRAAIERVREIVRARRHAATVERRRHRARPRRRRRARRRGRAPRACAPRRRARDPARPTSTSARRW